MSTKSKISRRQKLLALAPALVVLGITAIVASGMSIIPGAAAQNTVSVSGSVTASMSVSSDTNTAGCGNGNLAIGNFSGTTALFSSPTCQLTFASNDPAGAHVAEYDNDAAAPWFCTSTCTAGSNNAVENPTSAAGGVALAADQAGIALTATSGTPLPTNGTNFEIKAAPVATDTAWGAVGTAADTICSAVGATTVNQTCTMVFGVRGQGATQTAGTYTGVANLTAAVGP